MVGESRFQATKLMLIAPYYPEGRTGRPPFSLLAMLRIHLQSSNGSRCRTPPCKRPFLTPRCTESLRSLKSLGACPMNPPFCDCVTVNSLLIERGLLLKAGTVVDATLIAAPSSTKNKDKKHDPDMHSSKKGNQWYFAMKAHIGADANSGLVHTVRCTSGHVSDIRRGQHVATSTGISCLRRCGLPRR